MKLEVHERLALISLVPQEGGYAALKEYRLAKEMLSFTPQEVEFFALKNVADPATGKTVAHWNTQKAAEQIKDVPVTEFMTNTFRQKLSELESKGKLTEDYLSLYEKFVVIYQ